MDEKNNNKVINLQSAMGQSDQYHTKFGNYKPNDELLQATTRIKNQRDVIQERILKMKTSESRVSKSVFDKVCRDYSLQLETITELLNEKKAALKSEIKDLYIRREKLTVEVNRHKDILEEAEFRHFLGEFSQTQFHEVQNYETKEIEKLETDLTRIAQFIRSHEELFDPQDLGQPKAATPQPEVTKTVLPPVTQTQVKSAPEPTVQEKAPEPELSIQAKLDTTATDISESEIADSEIADSDVPETNEFEDLFADDDSDEGSGLAQSQSNIQNLINDDEVENDEFTPAQKKKLPLAETQPEDEFNDYFQAEKVDETSFKGPAPTPKVPESSKDTEDSISIKTQPRIPIEDSISDILDAIKIEDDNVEIPEATPEPLTAQETATPVPIEDGAEYVFKLISGELDQKEYPVKENLSIGRSSSNDIVLKAPKVSRQHAAVNKYNDQYIIIDLKSSNGVFVNGTKIDESVLSPNDEVSVGGYKFIFEKR